MLAMLGLLDMLIFVGVTGWILSLGPPRNGMAAAIMALIVARIFHAAMLSMARWLRRSGTEAPRLLVLPPPPGQRSRAMIALAQLPGSADRQHRRS